jgi:hypothetical protein
MLSAWVSWGGFRFADVLDMQTDNNIKEMIVCGSGISEADASMLPIFCRVTGLLFIV